MYHRVESLCQGLHKLSDGFHTSRGTRGTDIAELCAGAHQEFREIFEAALKLSHAVVLDSIYLNPLSFFDDASFFSSYDG